MGQRGGPTLVGLRRLLEQLDFSFNFGPRRNVLHLQPPPRLSRLLRQRPLHLLGRHGRHHPHAERGKLVVLKKKMYFMDKRYQWEV